VNFEWLRGAVGELVGGGGLGSVSYLHWLRFVLIWCICRDQEAPFTHLPFENGHDF